MELNALDDCEDDMGDKISNAAIVTQCMELAMTMIENTKIAKGWRPTENKEFGIDCVATLLTTDDQLETWDNANQFVADEEDDYQSVRATSAIFLDNISAKFQKLFTAFSQKSSRERFNSPLRSKKIKTKIGGVPKRRLCWPSVACQIA